MRLLTISACSIFLALTGLLTGCTKTYPGTARLDFDFHNHPDHATIDTTGVTWPPPNVEVALPSGHPPIKQVHRCVVSVTGLTAAALPVGSGDATLDFDIEYLSFDPTTQKLFFKVRKGGGTKLFGLTISYILWYN